MEKAREGKAIPDLSRSFHDDHDGRCEGGTYVTESSSEDLVDSALINGQSVRREPEHEPKRHVKVPQASQEETIPSPTTPLKDAILDITDVDLRVVTMSESFMDSMLVKKTFTPNDGHRLMEVLDMNLPVWKGEKDEHAEKVTLYYAKDGSTLLGLGINDGHPTKPKCFEKNGQEWSEISDDAFFNKHDLMVDSTGKLGQSKGLVPSGRSPIPSKQASLREPKDVVNMPVKPGSVLSNAVKRNLKLEGEPRSAGHAREPLKITFNIASPDSSSIETFIRSPYGVVTKVYRAKNGYRITSIVDSGVTIYKVPTDHSCEHIVVVKSAKKNEDGEGTLSFLVIYAMNGEGKKTPFYYDHHGHNGSGWKSIEESTFYSSFHNMVREKRPAELLTLDITKDPDPAFFYVNRSPKSLFTIYAPNSTCRVIEIKTKPWWKRGSTIWKRKKDEWCNMLSFYPREGDPTLLWIITKDPYERENILYFAKGGGCACAWNEITREVYMDKLIEAGFDGSGFTNEIILDISNVDGEAFHQHAYVVCDYSDRHLTPLPGYRLTKMVDNGMVIWKAEEGEHCTYVDVYGKKHEAITLYLLVKDKEGGRRIVYYAKLDGSWTVIQKSLYYDILAGRNSPIYTHDVDHPRITISSFKNRQGLRIISYSSKVNNSRGDIILIHGLRGSFMVDFNSVNPEWVNKHIGFPTFPYASPFGGYTSSIDSNPADMYRHFFENPSMPGEDVLQMSSRYQYEGTFLEALNRMGYNVYGYDHQSYGLSEAQTELKCYVKEFKDYVHDVLQFISIVKRGKFSDTTEVWNDATVFQNVDCSRKLFLIGYSLGLNIAMQAVQEFHRMVDNSRVASGRPIVDGIIGLSSMLSLENYTETCTASAKVRVLKAYAWLCPNTINSYDKLNRHGESFNNFSRYNDPFFFSGKVTLGTSKSMFDACDDVKKEENMAHYPMSLPTLFIHTKDDGRCSVKGPRDLMNKYFKGSQNAKFVELEGSCHYLALPYFTMAVQPHLKEWLDKYT